MPRETNSRNLRPHRQTRYHREGYVREYDLPEGGLYRETYDREVFRSVGPDDPYVSRSSGSRRPSNYSYERSGTRSSRPRDDRSDGMEIRSIRTVSPPDFFERPSTHSNSSHRSRRPLITDGRSSRSRDVDLELALVSSRPRRTSRRDVDNVSNAATVASGSLDPRSRRRNDDRVLAWMGEPARSERGSTASRTARRDGYYSSRREYPRAPGDMYDNLSETSSDCYDPRDRRRRFR